LELKEEDLIDLEENRQQKTLFGGRKKVTQSRSVGHYTAGGNNARSRKSYYAEQQFAKYTPTNNGGVDRYREVQKSSVCGSSLSPLRTSSH
jgi:hypothetical protein